MPLPNFNGYRAVWIEKTKSSHGHGGQGWEFGTCLWSPTRGKTGQRIYINMERALKGDLVLHFYEDSPFGKVQDYYFCGISTVVQPAKVIDVEPPQPGDWAGRGRYFRIELDGFLPFVEPLAISDLIARRGVQLLSGIGGEPVFVQNGGSIRLAQGKYLAECSERLYGLLSTEVEEEIPPPTSAPPTTKAEKSASAKAFDYEEYVEGQRARRETAYFVRNPQLVKDAKAYYQGVCQACSFSYKERYPDLGDGYVEIHHLNPLSERNNANTDNRLSKLAQVTALCANCHRMIHRLIRRLGRPVSLAEFQAHLSQPSTSVDEGPKGP
jgi:hypothetical protein